jgi:hypothetical protein
MVIQNLDYFSALLYMMLIFQYFGHIQWRAMVQLWNNEILVFLHNITRGYRHGCVVLARVSSERSGGIISYSEIFTLLGYNHNPSSVTADGTDRNDRVMWSQVRSTWHCQSVQASQSLSARSDPGIKIYGKVTQLPPLCISYRLCQPMFLLCK